jgi:hypothetical protein
MSIPETGLPGDDGCSYSCSNLKPSAASSRFRRRFSYSRRIAESIRRSAVLVIGEGESLVLGSCRSVRNGPIEQQELNPTARCLNPRGPASPHVRAAHPSCAHHGRAAVVGA